VYRHIAASRLHEFSMREVVLDSEELHHLRICWDCEAVLQRFVENQRRASKTELERSDDRQESA
jgi:hypothetical protein